MISIQTVIVWIFLLTMYPIFHQFLTMTKKLFIPKVLKTYTQSANPNATNSELDSKRIITHKELNHVQRDELIEQFVELQVDNMDTQTLVEFVTDMLVNDYSNFNDDELKERINCYDDNDGLYEELVDNITNNDPIVYNTNINGGKS